MRPLWKTVRRFPKILKIKLSYDPAIPLLGIYPKELKSGSQRDICTMFTAALFTIAKIWKQPKCQSTNKWIRITWCIHTLEYYSALKMKEFLTSATIWMSLEGIMLSEIRQSQKENTAWFHLYKLSNIVNATEAENRMVVAKGWWG